jgi:hypothetical protein
MLSPPPLTTSSPSQTITTMGSPSFAPEIFDVMVSADANLHADILNPRFSKRLITSPTRFLCTASGLTRTSVLSLLAGFLQEFESAANAVGTWRN